MEHREGVTRGGPPPDGSDRSFGIVFAVVFTGSACFRCSDVAGARRD